MTDKQRKPAAIGFEADLLRLQHEIVLYQAEIEANIGQLEETLDALMKQGAADNLELR